MQVQPYLFFEGRCEEALEFYKKAIGAEVTALLRYKDGPDPSSSPAGVSNEKVMHANMKIGDAMVMASDGMAQGQPEFKGFSLTSNANDVAEAERLFGALAAGGTVQQPLVVTFFSPKFGMLSDKFGVGWMIVAEPPAQKPA